LKLRWRSPAQPAGCHMGDYYGKETESRRQ